MERKIKLEISDDQMQAFITIPAEDKYYALKETDVIKILQANRVVFGILEDEIAKIITHKMFNRKVLVAKGRPPERGKDAVVNYRFNVQKSLAEIMEAKNEDLVLTKINYIQQAIEGQEVAIKQPATNGVEGIKVTGETIPAENGADVQMEGDGVRISQDGLRMLADRNGQVLLEKGKVLVVPLLVVEKDVDRAVGNVNFDGSVLVKGSVDSDYGVKATRDIEINGNVGKSNIEAGGNIFIKSGLQGKGEAQIKATRSIATKFVENANLCSDESIYINGHVMSSNIEARHSVIADGKRANMVGGRIMANERIQAAALGSRDNVTTRVEMATPALQKKWEDEQKKVLEPQIIAAYDMLKKIKDAIAKLEEKKEQQGGLLLPKEQAFHDRLCDERNRNQEDLEKRLSVLESIKKSMDSFKREVRVLGTIYVGVSIQIGEAKEEIRQPMQGIRFTRYGDHINPERI